MPNALFPVPLAPKIIAIKLGFLYNLEVNFPYSPLIVSITSNSLYLPETLILLSCMTTSLSFPSILFSFILAMHHAIPL